MSTNPATSGTGFVERLATVHQGRASAWRFALVVLALAWALLLLGGLLIGSSHDNGTHRIPTWCRLGSSLVLVIAGWTWFAATSASLKRYALLIALGMMLGFFGDLANADLLPLGLANPVLGGIIAFGLGHIAYIAACLHAGNRANLTSRRTRWVSLALWWTIGVGCWYVVAFRGAQNLDLRWPALPYTLLLSATTGMAFSLALQNARFAILALGAVLFLASDLVLAYQLFYGNFPGGGDAVWLLYGPGQMLIVYSVPGAGRAIERAPAI
jgi:hypothetical protein